MHSPFTTLSSSQKDNLLETTPPTPISTDKRESPHSVPHCLGVANQLEISGSIGYYKALSRYTVTTRDNHSVSTRSLVNIPEIQELRGPGKRGGI